MLVFQFIVLIHSTGCLSFKKSRCPPHLPPLNLLLEAVILAIFSKITFFVDHKMVGLKGSVCMGHAKHTYDCICIIGQTF